MRDRLIELIKESEDRTPCAFDPEYDCEDKKCGDCAREAIADHLLANGVIVPPCRVGDTVYVVSQGAGFSVAWNVYKATAKAIHLDRWGQLFIHVETDKENIGGYVEIERVFLTREQAERALAERIER